MDKFDEFELNNPEVEGIEEGLREGLRHVAAPPGFSDRVMARVAQREHWRQSRSAGKLAMRGLHRNAGLWTTIAAMLALTVGGNIMYSRHQQQERQAAQIQEQMDLAMELTGHALSQIQGNLDKSPAGQVLNSLGK